MGTEIERKFLVDKDFVEDLIENHKYDAIKHINQGYILNTSEKVVRVRIADNEAYVTIKGKNEGALRPEFEYEIPISDAEYLIANMCQNIIKKIRYIVYISDDAWEIDLFQGENSGLIVAEVEIPSIDYNLKIPPWVKEEVTDKTQYYNNNLSKHPYKSWVTGKEKHAK